MINTYVESDYSAPFEPDLFLQLCDADALEDVLGLKTRRRMQTSARGIIH